MWELQKLIHWITSGRIHQNHCTILRKVVIYLTHQFFVEISEIQTVTYNYQIKCLFITLLHTYTTAYIVCTPFQIYAMTFMFFKAVKL